MNHQCAECGGQCCKTMTFAIHDLPPKGLEFYLARGVLAGNTVAMPARCKLLGDDDRCTAYFRRPAACREFPVDGFFCRLARMAAKKLKISACAPNGDGRQ